MCTANQCRSPLVEFELRRRAQAQGLAWTVGSAGTRAMPGEPPHPHTRRLLAERGDDLAGWQSRRLSRELIDAADVIVTATVEQRSQVALLQPKAMRRTFLLLSLAQVCRTLPQGLSSVPASDADELAAALRARLPPAAGTLELSDPVGRRLGVFRRCHRVIEEAAQAIVGG